MMNCIIVDDEPLAREGLASYVREVDFLHLSGTCEHPLQLMPMLDQQPVDLLFLDIQMPKMSGIDFLKITPRPPMVVITTAYPSFALEGFQLNVLDYLLKPITFDRFVKSANKAREYHRLLNQSVANPQLTTDDSDFFFIKCGNKYEKLFYADILFIEGLQNYVTFFTTKGKYVTLLNFRQLEQNLTPPAFLRVHKSYVVAVSKIDSIEGNELFIQSHRIPISRNFRDQVMERVLGDKLWKK